MDFGGDGADSGGKAPKITGNGIKRLPTFPQDFSGTNYESSKYFLAIPTKVHGDIVDRLSEIVAQEEYPWERCTG